MSFFDPLPRQNLKTFKEAMETKKIKVNGKNTYLKLTGNFVHINHISDNLAIYFQNFIAAHCYILRGTKNITCFIDIKAISDSLSPERCKALPGLHALTGCNFRSAIVGKDKQQAAFEIMQ